MAIGNILSAEQENKIVDILNDNNKNDYDQLSDFLESQDQNSNAVKNAKEKLKNLKDVTSEKLKEVFLNKIDFGSFEKYKESIQNISEKIGIPLKSFVQILKKENGLAGQRLISGGKKIEYNSVDEWKEGAYGLGQVTPGTFDTIFNYLKGENLYYDLNEAKKSYLGIGVDDNTMAKTQLDFSAAYMKMILDKHNNDLSMTTGEIGMYYNAGINFDASNSNENVPVDRIGTNAANSKLVAEKFGLKIDNMSKKEYAERMIYYYGEGTDVPVKLMAKGGAKFEEYLGEDGKLDDNLIDSLPLSEKQKEDLKGRNLGSLGTLSVVDVMGFLYGGLNIFGAVMDGISGNWGDALQKAVIAFAGIKNIDKELNGNIEDFEKHRLHSIENMFGENLSSSELKKYNKILENVEKEEYEGNGLYFDFLLNSKESGVKPLSVLKNINDNIDFDKLNNLKEDEIGLSSISEVLNSVGLNNLENGNLFNNLNESGKKMIIDGLKIMKRDGIKNGKELGMTYNHLVFIYSKNRFDEVRKIIG